MNLRLRQCQHGYEYSKERRSERTPRTLSKCPLLNRFLGVVGTSSSTVASVHILLLRHFTSPRSNLCSQPCRSKRIDSSWQSGP
eukprot:5752639-Amphidinium_carterae.2